MRWLWLQKTEPEKPWAFFPIQVHHSVEVFFSIAIVSEVGNGQNLLFWTDRWLHGQSLDKLVPHLFGLLSSWAKKRTVYEALTDGRWVSDLRGAHSVAFLTEYFNLWELLANVVLQLDVEDSHIWQFASTGKYSAKSAYEAMFIGAIQCNSWERIWKSWAPGVFFSCGRLHITSVGRLISLQKKGLLHPEHCLLCDQEEETIDHLLVSYVFSRQIWFMSCNDSVCKSSPQPADLSFEDWWDQVMTRVADHAKQGLNSVIILVAWSLWNHRNRCIAAFFMDNSPI